jgi:hypothetical protein
LDVGWNGTRRLRRRARPVAEVQSRQSEARKP